MSIENMDVYLHDIITLRGDKPSRTLNLDENLTNSGAIETLTIMRGVPIETIRESCALLGYYLNLNYSFEPGNFSSEHDLSDNEREQFEILSSINNFDDYTQRCRAMLERVIKKGKQIFDIEKNFEIKSETNRNDSDNGGKSSNNNASNNSDDDEQKNNRFTLIHAMSGIFNNFYDLINNESLPPSTIYERLFVSHCLSNRQPLKLYREHLRDLNTLFSILTKTVIDTIDRCNTLFEAFYQTGILFTTLVDLIVYNDVHRNVYENDESRHWTRVRLLNPNDRESIHFIKNTNTPSYQRSIERLPEHLFDRRSGLDVYLSSNDTFSTLMSQFIGRMYLRLYEWIERSDVKTHLMEYFTCDNVHTLFANIGRGHDQRCWIRFFKSRNNRETKVFIKLEPLLSLNDEMITGNEERNALVMGGGGSSNNNNNNGSSAAGLLTNSMQLRSTVTQDVARRYHLLNDFLKRYNNFTENDRTGKLNFLWNVARTSFVQRSTGIVGQNSSNEKNNNNNNNNNKNNNSDLLKSLDHETSPLFSFKAWCEEINTFIFPFNFLLLTSGARNVAANVDCFDKETLDLAWTYRCQKYLMVKRFTSSKCRQILSFLQQFEIKSRMVSEEKEFVFLISSALENMPFIYELFSEMSNKSNNENDFLIDHLNYNDITNDNNNDAESKNFTKNRCDNNKNVNDETSVSENNNNNNDDDEMMDVDEE